MPKTERIPAAILIRYAAVPVESRFERIIRETKQQLEYSRLVKQTLERR